jgi:hypothetical protein
MTPCQSPETEDSNLREADRLMAATIYLMSCHARTRCPRLAYMVERHLELIARNPECGEFVRDTCNKLSAAWECVRGADEHHHGERAASRLESTNTRRPMH